MTAGPTQAAEFFERQKRLMSVPLPLDVFEWYRRSRVPT